jgi:formate-dependent nitrite reductase membrane component NrfD
MFGTLIIGYLFLGGAGAGSLIVLSLLENIAARRSIEHPARHLVRQTVREKSKHPAAFSDCSPESYSVCWPLCLAFLVFAAISLLFDLGRVDRVLNLFVMPSFSALSIGAYGLLIAIICAAAFSFCRMPSSRPIPRMLTKVISMVGIASGFTTAIYTGVLLQSLTPVPFWNSFLLPVLFALSALSTGIAVMFVGISFTHTRIPIFMTIRTLAGIDVVILVLEALALVAFLALAYADPSAKNAAHAVILGDLSWLFWAGLIASGLIVPFILETRIFLKNRNGPALAAALLILAGGLTLRICIVGAASYGSVVVLGLS